jgi:urease accessory protein
MSRDLFTRAFRVGIAGPVGSGKTSLIELLVGRLAPHYSLGVITNDIYTKDDAERLVSTGLIPPERVYGVETGDYPHTAIREDISLNREAIGKLEEANPGLEIVFIESGGDNLAAAFSPELVDVAVYVMDVAAGDRAPRKGGPGMVRSEMLVINKTDLARYVGASLAAMEQEARRMRGDRPIVFTNLKTGQGIVTISNWLESLVTNRFGPREAHKYPSSAQ